MLTQLSTVKSRLAIDEFDLQYDTLPTNAINGVSARFDKECNRTLSRTGNAIQPAPGCVPGTVPAQLSGAPMSGLLRRP
jgi:hypothetical protein